MNNSRTKRLPKIILGQSFVMLIILLISTYLIVYSMGYKINLSSRKIIKTGMIVLSVNPKPDSITINGESKPVKIDNSYVLAPGYYDILVKKEGYHDWSVRSLVAEEMVNYYSPTMLFKDKIKLEELTEVSKINYLNSPTSTLAENAPKGLKYNDYEIWIDDNLITRYSKKINVVIWYPDYHHLAYQQGSEIRIVDDMGLNDTLLVNLPDASEAKFTFGGKKKELYIYQSGKYYLAQIQ